MSRRAKRSYKGAVMYSCEACLPYGANYVGKNVTAQLGYKPTDFIRNPEFWVSNIHPSDLRRVRKYLKAVESNGRGVTEYRFRHKDGTYRWMRDEMKIVRDRERRPVEIVGYWHDITAEKETGARTVTSSFKMPPHIHDLMMEMIAEHKRVVGRLDKSKYLRGLILLDALLSGRKIAPAELAWVKLFYPKFEKRKTATG